MQGIYKTLFIIVRIIIDILSMVQTDVFDDESSRL